MSVVGIKILENMRPHFNGKSYLIKCYNEGKKFCSYLMDEKPLCMNINDTVIAYIKEDKQKFYIINVGGINENGKLIGPGNNKTPRMTEFREFNNEFELKDKKSKYSNLNKSIV